MICEEFQKLIDTQERIDQATQDAYDLHYASCASCKGHLDSEIAKAEKGLKRVDDGKGGYFFSLDLH